MTTAPVTRISAYVAAGTVALLLAATVPTHGQMLGEAGAPAQTPPPAYAPAPPPSAPLDFGAVMSSAYSETSFTFDRNMLQSADSFFGGADPETRRVVAGLNSITVKSFHARDFARYDPGALAFIDSQLRGGGWKHLVNANAHGGTTMTDLWLHWNGGDINQVTVLSRGDRNMSVISVDCTLRPLDLLHLSGHFGIPKVDQNAVMVPAN